MDSNRSASIILIKKKKLIVNFTADEREEQNRIICRKFDWKNARQIMLLKFHEKSKKNFNRTSLYKRHVEDGSQGQKKKYSEMKGKNKLKNKNRCINFHEFFFYHYQTKTMSKRSRKLLLQQSQCSTKTWKIFSRIRSDYSPHSLHLRIRHDIAITHFKVFVRDLFETLFDPRKKSNTR